MNTEQVTRKKSGGEVIDKPSFGQTGWLNGELVIYDGKSIPPRWLAKPEFEAAKAARSQKWKQTKGPDDYRRRHRLRDDETALGRQSLGCYGDEDCRPSRSMLGRTENVGHRKNPKLDLGVAGDPAYA